ncbi:hypothetical protein BC936DRAFT_145688 [Jimgerdemannia flammicorona]|uniref:F-box domain-containing protein n=1 Tax=Jimgerdemannia flammicorona TaxID=994334 RepID=A0A433D9G9_9FUNG|nr:hypothetical protein BC936DRAFT_145688 [Jimgerdemannia flammicorona]
MTDLTQSTECSRLSIAHTNSQHCKLKTGHSSMLNPDTLYIVFLYLVPTPYTVPPLDLFASSLVCKTWHTEARPFLDEFVDPTTFNHLFYHKHHNQWYNYTYHEIIRIAGLLAESRRNGLDHLNLIKRMTIPIDHDDANDSDFNRTVFSFCYILEQQPPNLTLLRFNLNTTIPRPNRLHRLPRLIFNLQSACGNISHLHLHGGSGDPARRAPFHSLIVALSKRLESLVLSRFTLDSNTHAALSSCTALIDVRLRTLRNDHLGDVVPAWSNLRSFHYRHHDRRETIDPVLIALARSCRRLAEVSISVKNVNIMPAFTYDGLFTLVRWSHALSTLRLVNVGSFSNNFLYYCLLRHGRRLEYIDLEGCPCFLGGAPVIVCDGMWPRIKSLSLRVCPNIYESFIRDVVAACDTLEEIVLPDHLDRGAARYLEPCRFRREAPNVWKRWAKPRNEDGVEEAKMEKANVIEVQPEKRVRKGKLRATLSRLGRRFKMILNIRRTPHFS